MPIKVGIPRGLMYYDYSVLWEKFFEFLDLIPVVSGPTNKLVIDQGSRLVSDEACLPLKVYLGQVAGLCEEKLDYIFVPRMVSIERKAYTCPKIIGLPDMVEAGKLRLPLLLKPTLNMSARESHQVFLKEVAKDLELDYASVREAWRKASALQEARNLQSVDYTRQGGFAGKSADDLTILLIGHNYNIYDSFLNLDLVKKLRQMGCRVILPEQFPRQVCQDALQHLPKQLFWSYGRILLGAAMLFSGLPVLKGAIIITSFGCGIDSFIGNMVMRHLARGKIPLLYLTLDEHTGEAGLITRIEAFIDMIRWRRKAQSENNFPPYGAYLARFKDSSGIPGPCSCSASPVQ